MSPEDILALNEQIAAMARAGLPLDKGLDSLAKDMGRGPLRSVTSKLAADLRTGQPLDMALSRRARSLPPYYAPLVAAGIRTGRLPMVLIKLSAYAKSINHMRSLVRESLFYPGIVLIFGLLIVSFLTFYILPQFESIFIEFGMSLPWLTRAILAISRVPGYIAAGIGVVALCVLTFWLFSRLTISGRRTWARFLYAIPIIGTAVRSARLALFADVLSMLVEFEVPMPEAFRAAGRASPDPIMATRAVQIAEELERGTSLASALANRGLVPEWMAWMTDYGEKQGQLAPALAQVAEVYRRQVEARSAVLRNVLPSFFIVFTAGFIALIFALAVIAPMSKLLEGLSQ